MEFGILGPLEVRSAEGAMELRGAKQRALLAALLLRANEVVSTDSLVECLWGARPAVSAAKLVQVYVSQLRRSLGEEGRIETRAPGYVLSLRPGELDSARFERLLDQGRTALAAGNAPRARRALGQALALWRGPALGEFAYEDFARADAERLEELRLAALEERIEADLALGRHERLVPELRALTERHPLRERPWRLLMLALYRAERQAEALESFAQARRLLVDELGLEPGEDLRQLQAAILRHDPGLAPSAEADAGRTNLPAPLSPLVGRERELAELVSLIRGDQARLLTLAGAGGSGKTRLAIELARALVDDFANGVFLVELAPLRDAELVPLTIAATLGLEPVAGESTQQALRRHLAEEELLLLVDNAEHLADAGPLLVELLEAAPDLKAIVTSRAVLHVSGERVYPVDPLEHEPAAELFLARAQAAEPRFVPSAADTALVAAICERVDRLPLAIELAAPRIRTLTLEALHGRLAQRLPVLTSGPRDLPARQQTLRSTLDWSHELLSPAQRQVFRCLSVFAGSFTHEAAEAVAGAELDAIETLVEHHLMTRVEDGRLLLLETVREYAFERLDESGERQEAQQRHARYFLEVARSANLTIEAEGPMRHELVIRERDNVRAALDWAQAAGEIELGLELAGLLENYWSTNSPLEGRRRLADLLRRADDVAGGLRAQALRAYGAAALILGMFEEGNRDYEASLDEYRRLGDERGVAIMLQRLSLHQRRLGHAERARTFAEESLRLTRKIGFAKGEAVALGVLGNAEMEEGNDERALELLESSVELCKATGFTWFHARALSSISGLLLRRNRLDESTERIREALALLVRMADFPGTMGALARLAQIAARRGDSARAGGLLGAIEAEEVRTSHGQWDLIRAQYEDDLRAAAGPAFEAARAAGRRLPLSEAIKYALSGNGAGVSESRRAIDSVQQFGAIVW